MCSRRCRQPSPLSCSSPPAAPPRDSSGDGAHSRGLPPRACKEDPMCAPRFNLTYASRRRRRLRLASLGAWGFASRPASPGDGDGEAHAIRRHPLRSVSHLTHQRAFRVPCYPDTSTMRADFCLYVVGRLLQERSGLHQGLSARRGNTLPLHERRDAGRSHRYCVPASAFLACAQSLRLLTVALWAAGVF
jgi:hypothetical protein